MTIFVRSGKGNKDRRALLPKALLSELKSYYQLFRPESWLFFSMSKNKKLCRDSILSHRLHVTPSPHDLEKWLMGAGFCEIKFEVGERLQNRIIGQEIFPLPKEYTSQLSLLTDQQYETGIRKIQDFIDSSYSKNVTPEFMVDISLSMVTAKVL